MQQLIRERNSWKDLLIVIIFVDDIIFGGNDEVSKKFLEDMKNEFEMSMIGEMKFFLGLKIVKIKKVSLFPRLSTWKIC